LNCYELYRLGGYPVYVPHLLLGLTITVLLTWLNYRGIQASARLSKITTFTFLTLVIIFALAGAEHGSVSNFHPPVQSCAAPLHFAGLAGRALAGVGL
jgi:amino acid transporter